MRHFCCCPCRGLAWRALRCKYDAATTPPKALGVWGCLRGQAENRGYHGAAAAAASSRVPLTHSTQAARPQSQGSIVQAVSVWDGGAAGACRDPWQWLIVVMAQVAVPRAARGAEHGATRGTSQGPPAPGHCSAVTSPFLLSLGSPGGGPGPARRGAAAVMLTCCPPAGDSPSPLSAPGSLAASPPSCGPHTSTCPAAHPAPGDTVGMGSVKDIQPGPHGFIPMGCLTTRSSHRGFTTPIPLQGFCKEPPAPKG